jgi:hypothetical protein
MIGGAAGCVEHGTFARESRGGLPWLADESSRIAA